MRKKFLGEGVRLIERETLLVKKQAMQMPTIHVEDRAHREMIHFVGIRKKTDLFIGSTLTLIMVIIHPRETGVSCSRRTN